MACHSSPDYPSQSVKAEFINHFTKFGMADKECQDGRAHVFKELLDDITPLLLDYIDGLEKVF